MTPRRARTKTRVPDMTTRTDPSTFLTGSSSGYIETLYARFRDNPDSVEADWRDYFQKLENGVGRAIVNGAAGPSWGRADWPVRDVDELTAALDAGSPAPQMSVTEKAPAVSDGAVPSATIDSIRALMMIRAYRVRGHLIADLDPLGLEQRPQHPELEPESYGFKEEDMDRPVYIDNVLGLETATVREILEIVRSTYCGKVGVEFMHINDPDIKGWIQSRIEGRGKDIQFTPEGKLAILQKLTEAEHFEKFLGKKYIGTKRFGLDGGEAMVPALEAIIKTGGQMGLKEIVIGMPHRGRLSVLANVMRKPFQAIFHEFHGGSANPEDIGGSGDVKYHLGTSSDREFDGNRVHLSLTANPSHLEAVDPVVIGKVRAKQTIHGDTERIQVLPLLLHGDAAFSGQGLVAECFMLSGLKGYQTGGTMHFVVNNQIGFTTSPQYSRSSPYPSDMAKFVQAPIFHVNGDDPEAVVFVTKLATEFRQTFKKDVVIDMFCYRRFGHNESDEPAFTQPLMYKAIKEHPTALAIYRDRLKQEDLITDQSFAKMEQDFLDILNSDFEAAQAYKPNRADWLEGRWSGLSEAKGEIRRASTGATLKKLRDIGKILTTVPDGFNIHRTLGRVLDQKAEALKSGKRIDWTTAEALAFGTLLTEGNRVRLSGQDSGRGTFSQRHSVFVDQKTEDRYVPLDNLPDSARFDVLDSPLSEAGVLGFEYGYSLAEPDELVLWEAQFGDFANGAQVIFDQFISSGEAKWLRMSGLVVLLPHGYEGQGPEHSSARLERFLQLCAEDNFQVANCTTPANYFHILRRQVHRTFRKPLILMTPKSLLRHKLAVSKLSEMGPKTEFHRVLWDDAQTDPKAAIKLNTDDKITRVILCTGKVYYDLFEERNKRELADTQILRVEQLYPFPKQPLTKELARFKNLETIVWCQEEPRNMGAWGFIEDRIESLLRKTELKPKRAKYAGRLSSASTATGLASRHAAQQTELVDKALTL